MLSSVRYVPMCVYVYVYIYICVYRYTDIQIYTYNSGLEARIGLLSRFLMGMTGVTIRVIKFMSILSQSPGPSKNVFEACPL